MMAVAPDQVFALELTLVKGHDLDRPIGLQEVTVTV
jgi:hypothetical protein